MACSVLRTRALGIHLCATVVIFFFSILSPAYGTSVLMIGDSITFGISSYPHGTGYADLVAEELAGSHSVVSIGCGGSGTFNWRPDSPASTCLGGPEEPVHFFSTFVIPNTPVDIASVMLGTNDASLGFTAIGYRITLLKIFKGLREAGASVVIAMTPPPRPDNNPDADLLTSLYAAVITDPITGLCHTTTGVVCGPDVFNLLDPNTDFGNMNVHPNAFGHQKIAGALVESILAIPEPSTALLLALGFVTLAIAPRAETLA